MRRLTRQSEAQKEPSESQWHFRVEQELEERINILKNKQRIAFLSGCERSYFPEDAGRSKFAMVYNIKDPDLPPARLYKPPDEDRLQKPVSTFGFGIGGLKGPRFAPDDKRDFPAPNAYQRSWNSLEQKQRFAPSVWIGYGLLDNSKQRLFNKAPNANLRKSKALRNRLDAEERMNNKLDNLWNKCHQIGVAFGSSTKQGRFGHEPKWNNVGPGHYALRELKAPKVPVYNSFLRGPAVVDAPTKLHCAYGPKEYCIECGRMLMQSFDYYRSRFRVPIPQNSISVSSVINFVPKVPKMRRVLLCRDCYCKALRGESRYWKKIGMVEWLFEKTRHCGYIHEHNGLPEYTEKASCKWTRKLARKEAILSRHYPDVGERKLKQRKQKWDT